jgi:radical SAM superfamily enzyme YgiQ (UPF0313 family)
MAAAGRKIVMSTPTDVLLVNPAITSRRNARFPLSVMNLAAAIEPDFEPTLIDGNLDRHAAQHAAETVRNGSFAAVGITVMGGPQVATAIDVSRSIRRASPQTPIVWGGYFPTLYPDVALNSDYVDYVVRGQGEHTFSELLNHLREANGETCEHIDGLSWRRDDEIVRNQNRRLDKQLTSPNLRYEMLGNPRDYLVRTFLGDRTVGHQAAIGCRFRCTFCGVAAMFKGDTALPPAERLDRELEFLHSEVGADSVQFYDHNFFDRETDMIPMLEVMAKHRLPWWCYARADALMNLAPSTWELIRKSQLRMAYIGAETPNDQLLRRIRKGTRSDQTLEVVELCRRNGVIPELSFMVAPPENTEEETEATFEFIRQIKRVNPEAEIIVYIDTPLPPTSVPNAERLNLPQLLDVDGNPVAFPKTPEEWTEQRWVDYACHADAPWLSERMRRRIRDFVTVLRCRFPTIQDTRSPAWAKATLRTLAGWRYSMGKYDRPWELTASHRLIGLLDPRATSI